MLTQEPDIARGADGLARKGRGNSVGRIVVVLRPGREPLNPEVDFAHFEAGCVQREVEVEHRQLMQLLGEQPIIPG